MSTTQKSNDLTMLEEGEVSNSSIESNNSIEFKNSTTTYLKCPPSTRSFQDTEKSLLEMFTVDTTNEIKQTVKPKKPFTGWTEQLLEAKQKHLNKNIVVSNQHDGSTKDKDTKEKQDQSVKKKMTNQKKSLDKTTKFVNDVAFSLKEKRKDIIAKIVEACGQDKTRELCTEALLIHTTSGMLTPDNKPRTLGGCFFQLVKLKGDLDESQKKEIFSEPTSQFSQRKKQIRNAKKKMKKQLDTQSKLEEIFSSMKINTPVQ